MDMQLTLLQLWLPVKSPIKALGIGPHDAHAWDMTNSNNRKLRPWVMELFLGNWPLLQWNMI